SQTRTLLDCGTRRRERRLCVSGEGERARRAVAAVPGRPEGARARHRAAADRRGDPVRARRRLPQDHAVDASRPRRGPAHLRGCRLQAHAHLEARRLRKEARRRNVGPRPVSCEHRAMIVLPPPRLTPELIAAYKREGERLRSEAFLQMLRRPATWLRRHSGKQAMSTANTSGPVLWSVDARKVAHVALNRPEVNNAYDEALIRGLLAALDAFGAMPGLRAVVVTGNGRHFQAGADLTWINAVRTATPQENLAASRATGEAIRRLNAVPVPTIALVQGGCFGGGTGLVAACDIVIAADNAMFSIAEVRWGLTAAIIIPQLNDAIGVRQVRRYALTGERFGAAEARRIGLVHEVVPAAELAAAGERMVDHLLANGPEAIWQTKAHALAFAWGEPDDATFDELVDKHAAKRRSPEAAEGLASFAEKRA